MSARVITAAFLLVCLVSVVGCASVKKDLACHWGTTVQAVKNFDTEFEYYEFNMPRAKDHPELTDRSIVKQMLRDLKATHRDIDWFLLDSTCDDYDHLPDP
jgi:hypothetical protein